MEREESSVESEERDVSDREPRKPIFGAEGRSGAPRPKRGAKRTSRRRGLAAALACVAVQLVAATVAHAVEAPARPNVVIFLADDLGWADVGYHGSEIATPGIDRLAREGLRLERFYANPICSPTRAALLSGRDALALGIAYDQINPWNPHGLPPDSYLITHAFRAAGYQTAMVGKWHLGHTQAHQLPNAQGFDRFAGHLHTQTDFFTHLRAGGHDLQRDGKSIHEDGMYLTRFEAREAVRFLEQRDRSKPFLLYVPFTAPHTPMQAPEETIAKYAHVPAAAYRRVYAAMVDEVDQAVVQVLDTLDRQGIAKSTIVLFTSDNGGTPGGGGGGSNRPLRGEKGQTFEGGIRVPTVLRWPGALPAGETRHQVLAAYDVLPTLAHAAGVALAPPIALDGEDRWEALRSDARVPRARPLFFASEIPLPGTIHLAVIDGPWKLVQVLREQATRFDVQQLLFRIEDDPNEKNDLAATEPQQVARLAEAIAQWRRRHPIAGTRSSLVPPPGWLPPKDWADAVVPSSLLQARWRNELPFSGPLLDALAHRGVLIDDATREQLMREEAERTRALEAQP